MQLIIPGLEGMQGVLETRTVDLGEDLTSLSRRNQVPVADLARLNHLTSPGELYAGSSLVLPVRESASGLGQRATISPGQSLLELAVLQGTNPWSIVQANGLAGTVGAIPGDTFFVHGTDDSGPGALPGGVQRIQLTPQELIQGKTAVVSVTGDPGMALNGSLAGKPLNFFQLQEGNWAALQGVHAMTEPGIYPLIITGTLSSGAPLAFSQAVLVNSGDYPFDPVITVNSEMIDPAVTKPEDAQWAALTTPVTPVRQWEGQFTYPVPDQFKDCFPSRFGDRRSYNGSGYIYFHTGLDFCGRVGTEIYAPADGTVVFTGPLTVRGNATVIDHGWGVYTAYMHQSEIKVRVGQQVKAGDLIGLVGATGRVTGPHLHFEVVVGGVQVDPMDWLAEKLP